MQLQATSIPVRQLLDKAGLTGDFGEDVLAGPWENSSVVKIADDIAVLNTLGFFHADG